MNTGEPSPWVVRFAPRFGWHANPDFLLRPGELLRAVQGHLRVLAYEDLTGDDPKPAARQRIAAQRELSL
ncbi:MAG: hypothetical protein GEU81_13925 [Nitriliruptorales bacterium]|nr:hypothetical protein [Nitriliruptorales bacterium]